MIYFASMALSNAELGERIGVTHSMASRIRAGKRLPSPKVMTKIGTELGIAPAELLAAHNRGPKAFGALVRQAERDRDRAAAS